MAYQKGKKCPKCGAMVTAPPKAAAKPPAKPKK